MTPYVVWFLWVWGGLAAATLICGAACLWGGPPERLCGATLWIAWVLSLVVDFTRHNGIDNLVVAIDCACLVVFTALSFKWRHIWTLLVAASQLDDIASHVAARATHFGRWSYAVVTGLWGGQLILVCLLVATINHQKRLKRLKATLLLPAAA